MNSDQAQSNREWWAQQWIEVLESIGFAARLARARNYARSGNVVSLDFSGARVLARVQGTAPEPYRVSLALDVFDDEQWQFVIESIASQAIFSAKLLAGEMPRNIQEVFTANGLSLFPFTKFDIHSRCNCPDKANPCKHIGAVYYLLGDRFSADPFVLFQLRGRTREQVITALRSLRSGDSKQTAESDSHKATEQEPLHLDRFWKYDAPLDSDLVVITPAGSADTLLHSLGTLPVQAVLSDAAAVSTTQAVMEDLQGVYTQVSQKAMLQAMAGAGNSSFDTSD